MARGFAPATPVGARPSSDGRRGSGCRSSQTCRAPRDSVGPPRCGAPRGRTHPWRSQDRWRESRSSRSRLPCGRPGSLASDRVADRRARTPRDLARRRRQPAASSCSPPTAGRWPHQGVSASRERCRVSRPAVGRQSALECRSKRGRRPAWTRPEASSSWLAGHAPAGRPRWVDRFSNRPRRVSGRTSRAPPHAAPPTAATPGPSPAGVPSQVAPIPPGSPCPRSPNLKWSLGKRPSCGAAAAHD